MAEIILGLLLVVVGIGAVGLALLVVGANAIGGATNASAVNYTPAFICIAIALAAFAGGGFLLF